MGRTAENCSFKNLFITGDPGVGKTTLMRHVLSNLPPNIVVRGFITDEIRESGSRVGFAVSSLQGDRHVLAHRNITSPYRVGRYGVDVASFDRFVAMLLDKEDVQLWVIDEIGKMECFSHSFCRKTRSLLDSEVPLFGTVSAHGGGFISEVKSRKDCDVIKVTLSNRDSLIPELTKKVLKLLQFSMTADNEIE